MLHIQPLYFHIASCTVGNTLTGHPQPRHTHATQGSSVFALQLSSAAFRISDVINFPLVVILDVLVCHVPCAG